MDSSSVDSSASTRLRLVGCFVGRRWLFGNREVDHVPLLVDHGCVLDEEFERLPTCKIRAYRLQHASPFEVATYLFDLLLEPLGQALDLGVDLVVARPRSPLASTTARSARSASTARTAPSRTLVDERLRAPGRWPGGTLRATRSDATAGARDLRSRRRVSSSTSTSGAGIGTRSATASNTLSRVAMRACNFCTVSSRWRMSSRSSSTVSNSLASSTHSSVSSGNTLCFASFTITRNVAVSPARSPKRSGNVAVELEDRAGTRAAQLLVELGHDHVGADAVEEVGDGEPLDRLAVDRSGDVDRSRTRRRSAERRSR